MRRAFPILFALLLAVPASADEGMWLLNDFPSDRVADAYGFEPSQEWLDHVRLSAVRLAGGCSGSFVSGEGLILTNHHCAAGCIQQLSTAKRDYMQTGFVARDRPAEVQCPEIEINQLVEIRDVTDRVRQATAGREDAAFNEAQKAEMSRIEKECVEGGKWRCDVVTLYHGGSYQLYRYKRYQDVRLVFAPEFRIAFFGGDPDNFMFPRYDLDVSLLRVYEDGKPAATEHFFRWSAAGARDGDLVFVAGHPGSTQRLLTVAQLEFLRDVQFPSRLKRLAELRGLLTQFGRQGPEQRRISLEDLFGVENAFKAYNGEWQALVDKEMFARKVAQEQVLRATVDNDPDLKAKYGDAWGGITKALESYRPLIDRHELLELGRGFGSDQFQHARILVRAAAERTRENEKRLREYRDSALPSLTQRVLSKAPIYPELEEVTLAFTLSKIRELLGADDPDVRLVLGKESPEDLARSLVRGSRLRDPAVRKALWDGGQAAVDASKDPMILLAKRVDARAREIRKQYEDGVEAPIKKHGERIAQAHFRAAKGRTYPDATFTLRLTYGAVKGYDEKGRRIDPVTTIGGAFDRATGKDPFKLPDSWIKAKPRLDLSTPFNFASTCDIIGGNSGSPVVDRDGRVVGLIFDGNIQSLGGAFWFDESVNRAVAVESTAILEALKKVYGAGRLVKELGL